MGSGCLTMPISNNCGTPVSSNCVKYMGDPVPALGICTGDTITEVEAVLIAQIQALLTGTGITLNQVTLANCAYLSNMFAGKDKSLSNLLQLLVDSTCNLKELIDNVNEVLQPSGYVFDLKCLDPITDPTSEKIIQGLINKLCDLQTTVDDLIAAGGDTTLINDSINTALLNLISTAGSKGMKKTTAPSGLTSYYFTGLSIPFGATFYFGPLNVFDNSGLGIAGTYAEGWAICNGNNGMMDMRGFVPVGAIQGIPGPTLDSLVDPSANGDNSMNYAVGSKGGVAKVSLTGDQNGPHTHTTQPNTHSHGYTEPAKQSNSDKGGTADFVATQFGTTDSATINVVVNASGLGAPHENRMPYKAGVWVARVNV
jgi:microcystin-dependent protein